MKETHDNMDQLLSALNYNDHGWLICGDLKVVGLVLVHRGLIFQTVVSSWTIDAGESLSHTIKTSDLDGKSTSGNYYFRFNSNPLGQSYSVSGTFNE